MATLTDVPPVAVMLSFTGLASERKGCISLVLVPSPNAASITASMT